MDKIEKIRYLITKFLWLSLLFFVLAPLSGQDSTAKKYEGFVNITADPVFGIYPTLQIGRNIRRCNVFFYAMYYYQGREVVRSASVFKHWLEMGPGVSIKLPEKNSSLSLSIGIMDGKYYSGIKEFGFGDAIDPGFSFTFDNSRHYFNIGGYYIFSISSHGPIPYDLIWYWSNYAYAFKKNFYVGLYYEHFCQVSDGTVVPAYTNNYQWFGPSLEYRYKRAAIKLTAGYDVVNDFYYKTIVSLNF